MFDINCDEFALTLPIDLEKMRTIPNYFELYIGMIDEKLELTKILGNKEVKASGINGYTHCWSWGYDSKKVNIFYNPDYIQMKMMIKFSASSLKNYLYQVKLQLNKDISAMNIIKKLNEIDVVRLSRLDIAVDYINENITVNNLFEKYQNGDLVVLNKRNSEIKISNYIGAETVETLYFNRRANRSFLRIYNKKIEQEKNSGDMLKTALNCESWTRFELELKKEYAHAMTKIILNCDTEDDFNRVLAHAFIDCIKIREIDSKSDVKEFFKDTDFYNRIVSVAKNDEKLITTKSRDRLSSYELKYRNLSNNGTLALFKMIKESYSDDDFERFIDLLKDDIDNFELSKEHKKLVDEEKKHSPFF